jgi:hypothetical protein
MGEAPDWYSHIRAARYLGVAPWELSEAPAFWRAAALEAESAEFAAREHHEKRQQQQT